MIKKFNLMAVVILAAFLSGSCSDNEQLIEPQTEISVTFNVSTLNVGTQPMSRATNSGADLWDVVNTIGYYIYNNTDYYLQRSGISSFVPGVEQVPDNFGQITEKLMPGSYQAVFYAIGKGNGTLTFTGTDQINSGTSISYKDKEVFYYHENFTVAAESNMIEINMPRKSAMLKIDITDELTSDIGKVTYTISDGCIWNIYYSKNDRSTTYTYEASKTNNKLDLFEYYFSFPNKDASISIAIYDKSETLIGKKDLTIPLFENRRTIISGELFSSLGSNDINIIIDDVWGEDVNIPIR